MKLNKDQLNALVSEVSSILDANNVENILSVKIGKDWAKLNVLIKKNLEAKIKQDLEYGKAEAALMAFEEKTNALKKKIDEEYDVVRTETSLMVQRFEKNFGVSVEDWEYLEPGEEPKLSVKTKFFKERIVNIATLLTIDIDQKITSDMIITKVLTQFAKTI